MKKFFTLIVIAVFTCAAYAQVPQRMSYQCVVRNSAGALLANQAVGMKISIRQGTATGTVIFSETYAPNPQTNANGLVTLEIGSGTATVGTLEDIDWSAGPYFLETETDPAGGTAYTITGTSQLLTVPYAFYAMRAANGFSGAWADLTGIPSFATVATSGSYNDLLNKPSLFDGTWPSLTGKPVFATVATTGLFADLLFRPTTLAGYGITDADNSNTNEIQNLSLSGTQLSLSLGGGTVTLPSSGGGDNWGTQTVVTDGTLTGLGITSNPLQIANGGVTSAKILDGSILTQDFANFNVTSDKLANNSVTTEKINAGAVTGIKIAQGGATSGQVLKWNGTIWAPASDNEGGLTLPYSGTATSGGPLFHIINLGTSGAISTLSNGNYGIWGESANSAGIGVYGVNKNSSGTTYGVFGDVYSSEGFSGFFQGGKFYVENNAGFGTQNPAGMVEVYGNSVDHYPHLILSETDGYARIFFRTMLASSKHWVLAGHTNANDDNSQWHLNYNNGTIGKNMFSVYGDSRIAFDGNVGIGMIDPQAPLQVHSNLTYAFGITPIIKISDNFKTWNIGLGASGDRFSIASEDLTERLTILKSNGNVGIGTLSPGSKLEVAGQVKITGGSPGSGKVLTSDASGLSSWQTPQISPWMKNGSDIYYNTGNVAIGMTFPRYELTIYQDSDPHIGFYNSTSGTSGTDGFTISTGATGSPVWIWNWENSNMHFGTNNTNRMIINADGHVSMMRYLDINTDGTYGALYVKGKQALWWDGTYFSWGYDAAWNYFADRVSIGRAQDPTSSYMLYVQGSAYSTGSWTTSDARLKKNISEIDNPLSRLMKTRGTMFEFRTDEYEDYNFTGGTQYGFIAQEIEDIFPEVVNTDNNGYKSVNYNSMVPVLLEAIKEQQHIIDGIEAENNELKTRLCKLEEMLTVLVNR